MLPDLKKILSKKIIWNIASRNHPKHIRNSEVSEMLLKIKYSTCYLSKPCSLVSLGAK